MTSLTCLWISTGAYIGNERPHSKRELRRALAEDAAAANVTGYITAVRFDVTAPEGSHRAGETILATAADIGDSKLNVTGPDPASPLWWAIVEVSKDGQVTVA